MLSQRFGGRSELRLLQHPSNALSRRRVLLAVSQQPGPVGDQLMVRGNHRSDSLDSSPQSFPVAPLVDEDQLLIERALGGDRAAFGHLALRYQDRLYSSMLGVTGSVEEAEDVVQDALVRAFLKLDSFQQNSQFFTWLYRIAFNVALSRHRRRRSRISIDQTRDATGLEPVDDGELPDEPMLRRERVDLVRRALSQLTEQHRSILILREMEECSYEQIAEILEISIGTVRSRISRARGQLKLALESMRGAEEPR